MIHLQIMSQKPEKGKILLEKKTLPPEMETSLVVKTINPRRIGKTRKRRRRRGTRNTRRQRSLKNLKEVTTTKKERELTRRKMERTLIPPPATYLPNVLLSPSLNLCSQRIHCQRIWKGS
jgi:hypothetical protein